MELLNLPGYFHSQHIAAAKGKEHCLALLLEYGADPNQRGIFCSSNSCNLMLKSWGSQFAQGSYVMQTLKETYPSGKQYKGSMSP